MKSKIILYARFGIILHSFVLILLILHLGKTLFIPLFFSFLTANFLYPVTLLFERLHFGKKISAILSVLLFISFVGSILLFFNVQAERFLKDFPKVQERFLSLVQKMEASISGKLHINDTGHISSVSKSLNDLFSATPKSIGTTFMGVVEFIVFFIFFLIFTFFIINQRKLLKRFLLSFFSESQQPKVEEAAATIRTVIKNYVLGLLTEMAILFVLIFVTLLILGIKYALLMGLMAAILNIIPYIGIYTAAAFSMLISLGNGTTGQPLEIVIVFIIVHFLDANIILPYIVGGRVKINPFITVVAVILGNLLWGIPGMFLFIPLTAIVRIISERVDDFRSLAILIGEEK